jgi:hypothetical protein
MMLKKRPLRREAQLTPWYNSLDNSHMAPDLGATLGASGHRSLHLAEGSVSNVGAAPVLCRRRQNLEQQWAGAPSSFSDPS